MRPGVLVLALGLFSAACGTGMEPAEMGVAPSDNPYADAAASITAEDMYQRVSVLAHDSMRGRDTPSPELDEVANYIADEFRRMGLEGGAEDGAYIQRYPFPLVGLDLEGASLAFRGIEGLEPPAYGDEFLIFAGEEQTVTAAPVFVGPAAEFGESDPADNALADVLPVVYLAGTPSQQWQQQLFQARSTAGAAGARALLVVLDPAFPPEGFDQLRGFLEQPRRAVGGLTGTTMVLMEHDAAASIFDAAGLDFAGLRTSVEAATTPVPLPGVTASLGAATRVLEQDEAPNVVGLLRGSDPELRDTYVIMSAHIDHVGVGRPDESGDSIYNGADDDASGTSAMLEVAEAFTHMLQRPARSVLFLGVSGEEKGLLGSRYYSDNPTVPIESIVANINVDMIGRNSPDSVVAIGQEYSSLGPLVQQVGAEHHDQLGLTVSEDIWPEERFFFRSDHFNFARKEIPALFFFTGVHEDYHQPSDEVDALNTDKAARVARLIFYTTAEIAGAEQAPEWTEEGLAEVRALTQQ